LDFTSIFEEKKICSLSFVFRE